MKNQPSVNITTVHHEHFLIHEIASPPTADRNDRIKDSLMSAIKLTNKFRYDIIDIEDKEFRLC